MLCNRCGREIGEDSRFCRHCGAEQVPVVEEMPPEMAEEGDIPAENSGIEDLLEEKPKAAKNGGSGKKWIFIAAAVCVVILVAIAGVTRGGHAQSEAQEAVMAQYTAFMDQGQQAVEKQEYTQAVKCYNQALELAVDEITPQVKIAQVRLYQQEVDKAKTVLSALQVPESHDCYDEYKETQAIANLEPVISRCETTFFPTVMLSLDCGSAPTLQEDAFEIQENDTVCEMTEMSQEDSLYFLSYEAPAAETSEENRSVSVTIHTPYMDFTTELADYITPHCDEAVIQLVTTDISEYPKIKAYFRVEDLDGNELTQLTEASFRIEERIEGGEYLAREVKKVSRLEGNAGLNIALAADKSSSISGGDMGKIKSVMSEFVSSLQYNVGDKAEVLAFDTIVQQMCSYTNDRDLLVRGIQNMATDGLTAFYDAVYAGVNHAALQGGARCVIAFTDGMDNSSGYTAQDVIVYANQKQVPVYIIGVGSSVETGTLQDIANTTGGHYWYIDDLYDLQEIFNEIYQEQKQMYVVEYESDSSLDAYLQRQLSVKLSYETYRAANEFTFTPTKTVQDNGGVSVKGGKRYEVMEDAMTWEQASQKCQEMGGHLATITSRSEEEQIIALCEQKNIDYAWIGGYTSIGTDGSVFGHWVTGEDFSYENWSPGEPSRRDTDGTEEWYVILWNIEKLGGWTWNDERNDPASVNKKLQENMGYVCEFE